MKAIDSYIKQLQRLMLERKLYKESGLLQDESMNVLRDFEEFEYGTDS